MRLKTNKKRRIHTHTHSAASVNDRQVCPSLFSPFFVSFPFTFFLLRFSPLRSVHRVAIPVCFPFQRHFSSSSSSMNAAPFGRTSTERVQHSAFHSMFFIISHYTAVFFLLSSPILKRAVRHMLCALCARTVQMHFLASPSNVSNEHCMHMLQTRSN